VDADEAWEWSRSRPWMVGCNYIPSTAANQIEMWQEESFDEETNDRELGWAAQLGFNTVRVFALEVKSTSAAATRPLVS